MLNISASCLLRLYKKNTKNGCLKNEHQLLDSRNLTGLKRWLFVKITKFKTREMFQFQSRAKLSDNKVF